MSENFATANIGGFKTTIHVTGTVDPVIISNAVENSNIALAKKTAIITLVEELTSSRL